MLTKDQIKQKLQQDPNWIPDEDASEEEWEMYDEAREEAGGKTKVSPDAPINEALGDIEIDDDYDWSDEDDDDSGEKKYDWGDEDDDEDYF